MVVHEQDAAFAGTLDGRVHWELADECQPHQPVRTLWEVEGELSPLGQAKAAGRHCADDRGGGFGGRVVFTAESGDTLLGTYTFDTVSMTPELLTIRMTGTFDALVKVHTVTVPPTVDTVWPVEYTFDGHVSY